MIKAKGMTYPGTMLSNGSAKALHNSCIDLEQIITSHAWFAWYSCRDDDHVTSFQSFSKVFFPSKSLHLKETRTRSSKNITMVKFFSNVAISFIPSHLRENR
jgi:hypothetical protein